MEDGGTVNQQRRMSEPSVSPEWESPTDELMLGDDEVHVWRASLDVPEALVRQLQETLDAAEIARAERFYFRKDRNHFVVARGLLKAILGQYLNIEPHSLRFGYGAQGKPYLWLSEDNPPKESALRFNLSHSAGIMLLAVARDRELGIDVERIRPEFASETIAEQFFSPRETATLRALPAEMQPAAFFNCWTRKEAYIKARTEGLSFPLDQFDVSLSPDEPPALLSVNHDSQEVERWSLYGLDPGPGFTGALVVEGHCRRLLKLHWSPDCTR